MRPEQQAPIVICGGSLAGISAAIRLKQEGYDVRVIDKARFPRAKLCGEFLGPDSFPCLIRLGIFKTVQNQAYGPVETATFYSRNGRQLRISLSWISREYPYALAISRYHLDRLLVEHARRLGITVIEQCRVLPGIRRTDAGFELSLQQTDAGRSKDIGKPASPHPLTTMTTPIVIDATGRHGGLFINRPEKGGKPKPEPARYRTMIGIQCHAHSSRQFDPNLHMFFFPGGYGGIQPISAHEINICMLARREIFMEKPRFTAENYHRLMAGSIGKNPVAAELLSNTHIQEDMQTTANLNLDLSNTNTGLLQIGDAMITLDPFTGSGMAHALETGMMSAETLMEGLRKGMSYTAIREEYLRRYRAKFKWRLQLLRRFRPLLFSENLQQFSWPLLRPFLPKLAQVFR